MQIIKQNLCNDHISLLKNSINNIYCSTSPPKRQIFKNKFFFNYVFLQSQKRIIPRVIGSGFSYTKLPVHVKNIISLGPNFNTPNYDSAKLILSLITDLKYIHQDTNMIVDNDQRSIYRTWTCNIITNHSNIHHIIFLISTFESSWIHSFLPQVPK